MSQYLRGSVPTAANLFVLDARVTFLAGREPSRSANGYLVDPYGHFAYLGFELGGRSTIELILALARGEKHVDSSVVTSPRVQADLLARLHQAEIAVIHKNERWRLTPAAEALAAAEVDHYGEYALYELEP